MADEKEAEKGEGERTPKKYMVDLYEGDRVFASVELDELPHARQIDENTWEGSWGLVDGKLFPAKIYKSETWKNPRLHDGTELLRKYRDDTMKAISELEPKLKDTGLLENELYQMLRSVFLGHIDAAQIDPLVLFFAMPAYYSFGYFIYGFLEGKGIGAKELMGEEAYRKFKEQVDGKWSYSQWTDWLGKVKAAAAPKHDPISPPDPLDASPWK